MTKPGKWANKCTSFVSFIKIFKENYEQVEADNPNG